MEDQHFGLWLVDDPLNFRLVDVDVLDAVFVDDVLVLVVSLADVGIDAGGLAVGRDPVLETAGLEPPDDAFELPRRGRSARRPGLRRDAGLQDRLALVIERVLIAGHLHDATDVFEDRLRLRPEDRDLTLAREVVSHSACVSSCCAARMAAGTEASETPDGTQPLYD